MTHRYFLPTRHRGTVVASLLLFAGISQVNAVNIMHISRRFAPEANAVPVEISLTELNKVTQATLYARVAGSQIYLPIPMLGGGRTYRGEIPAHLVKMPGVEYYFQAQTTEGGVVTFPVSTPDKNPLFIRISTASPRPTIRILSPAADSNANSARPVISASLSGIANPIDQKSVKISLDGQNVTASSKISSTHVQYKPPVPLSPGKHTVKIEVSDTTGLMAEPQSWNFQVTGLVQEESEKEEEWKTVGTLSSQYQYSRVDSAQGTSNIAYPNGFATGNMNFRATRKDEEFFVGPLYFTTQETENQQPAQSLAFGYKNKQFETQWGNVSANLTQLTGGGSMMGGEMVYYTQDKNEKKGWRFQVDGGRTRMAVEADKSNFGVGVYAQRLVGAKVDHFYNDVFSWYAGAKDLRDIQNSLENPGNAVPLVNQAVSAGFDYKKEHLLIDSLKGEIGYSYSDLFEEAGTKPKEYQDAAWNLSTAKKINAIKTGLNFDYSEFRPEFIGGGSDTRSFNLSGNSDLHDAKIMLDSKYGFSHDNLESQKQATTHSHNASLTPSFKFTGWPVFSLTEAFNLQDTFGNKNLESETINNTVSANVSHTADFLQKKHSGSVSVSQNNSISQRPGSNSETVARSASATYSLPDLQTWLGLDLSYSFNISESSGSPLKSLGDSIGLNLNFQIPAIKLTIPLGININRSWDTGEPKTADNLTLSITQSISYTFLEKHNFSLSLAQTNYYDYINPTSDYRQFSMTFSYNTQF